MPNVYYARCSDCRRPIKGTGADTRQRFQFLNRFRLLNPHKDVVYDRDPRPGLPPLGFSGWCRGHELAPGDPGRIGTEPAIAGGWPLPRNPDE